MHILCLPSWYPNRYNENSAIFIKKHIDILAKKYELNVLYIHADSQKQNFEPELEIINELNYKEFKYYYKKSNVLLDTYYHIQCLVNGYKFIVDQSGKPQINHLFVAYPAGLGALYLKWRYGLRYIITEHWTGFTEFDPRFRNYSLPVRWFIKKIFAGAYAVSAISQYLINELMKNGLVKEKPFLISNKLELDASDVQGSERENSKTIALSVSNLDDFHKNIKGLIDSVAKVVTSFPDFELHIIGDGPDKDSLVAHAEKLNLLNIHIFFEGYIPNKFIADEYKKADFFILNSNFETFSIATIEAIANGKPVVVTRCGGPEEFVDDTNGILVERDNVKSLAEGIKKMIQSYRAYNPAEISKSIKERYSTRKVAEQLKEFYKLAGSKAGL
jgi:glycosyltransferase involved in cell wall biosynthesis